MPPAYETSFVSTCSQEGQTKTNCSKRAPSFGLVGGAAWSRRKRGMRGPARCPVLAGSIRASTVRSARGYKPCRLGRRAASASGSAISCFSVVPAASPLSAELRRVLANGMSTGGSALPLNRTRRAPARSHREHSRRREAARGGHGAIDIVRRHQRPRGHCMPTRPITQSHFVQRWASLVPVATMMDIIRSSG
jgi:hypothetical protein